MNVLERRLERLEAQTPPRPPLTAEQRRARIIELTQRILPDMPPEIAAAARAEIADPDGPGAEEQRELVMGWVRQRNDEMRRWTARWTNWRPTP